ncbi:HAD family hydrolase [Paenibacillus cymbidii]|uniref:hypothetical protein n=1 Tax=Paenibacillus cymbidii TaxID=1639034 RepID=UPI001080BEEB|nr:hypothetical protein [Paenibacillus cymbidii]
MNERLPQPKALLIDMDDTIIAYEHGFDVNACWRKVCGEHLAPEEARLDEAVAGMIGDNFEWEIAAPARLGVHGVWVNPAGKSAPDPGVPHRSIVSLRDLVDVLPGIVG